jgi:hypothetical protein
MHGPARRGGPHRKNYSMRRSLDVVAARIGPADIALLFAGAARTPCSTVHR